MNDASLDLLTGLLKQARSHGADAADAVLFETRETAAARRMGQPENIERSESRALGLRVFCGQRQAMVSSNDTLPETLNELVGRAVAMARAAPADPDALLAPSALLARDIPDLQLLDDNEPTREWLDEQCREAEESALSVNGITNSEGADASYSRSRISLAIDNGHDARFAHSYGSSHFSLSVSVLAGTESGMERDYDFASARHRHQLQSAESIGHSAARRALSRLHPRKPSTCRVPVIFDPRVGRGLLHVFASAISGSAVSRRASFLKHSLNTSIFPAGVTIIDNPHRSGGLGSKPFDGEGVANARRTLVENGRLTTWLLDLRTAHKLHMTTTGNATRGIASPPSPASTNLYMENGTLSPQALMRDIQSGLYVTETFGHGVNIVTGDYSQGAAGFWIENGDIAYPVSECTIAGNLKDMFLHLTPANDLAFRYATNAPTLRVDGMTVAGA